MWISHRLCGRLIILGPSNFTYFLDDPVNGDEFERADRRFVFGGRATHRVGGCLAGKPSEFLIGVDLRRDDIGTVGLYHARYRARLWTVREDTVHQMSVGAYARHDLQWSPWLRSSVGVRADRFDFDVEAGDPLNSGQEADGIVSPKASLILGPWAFTELYFNWGEGFHLNDARGATITVDPTSGEPARRVTPLVRAGGEEVGIRSTRLRHVQATAAWWRLDLVSELLFVGDAGTTEAGRPSTRRGVELNAVYSLRPWFSVDADVSLSRARFRDDDPAGARVPGAVERVLAGGVIVENAEYRFWQCSRPSLRCARSDRGRKRAIRPDDDCERWGGSRAVASRAGPCRRVQPAEPAGERHGLFLSVAAARRGRRRHRRCAFPSGFATLDSGRPQSRVLDESSV